ncbi:restriction endonuclease subunit S [Brevibacterium sp. PAMC21349]|nr:restriction endonuclease subunit S [Brevibacterium sp. PAMC21349]
MSKTMPEVRFDGFSGDWEEKKLNEGILEVSGNDGRTDLPILTISAKNGWMEQKDRFSQVIAGNELKNYTLLKKGELSYNHGNSKFAKYGVVVELKNHDEALVPRVYHSFKSNDKSDASFIEYLFSSKIPDRELGKLITSGARMDGLLNISKQAFWGISICLPSSEEQQKIGDFFKKLDHTIALQQRLVEQQQQYKKAMLQRMFPKNGEEFPELRFSEFTNSWEQRKLGEVIKTHSFQKYLANPFKEGKYEVIQQGSQPILGYSNEAPFEEYDSVTLFGDHTLSLYKPESPFLVATDGIKILSIPSFDSNFTFTLLDKYRPESQGYKRHFSILKNTYVSYSTNVKEQTKIGAFFIQLDYTIAHYQKKLEDYQQLKKALLQRMFV